MFFKTEIKTKPLNLKWSGGILLLRVVGFLAKFKTSGVPITFVIRNKPKKVKIESMLSWYMFPPQILMLDWRIIGSYRWIMGITILLSVEFLIGVPCWNDRYRSYVVYVYLLVVWCRWLIMLIIGLSSFQGEG